MKLERIRPLAAEKKEALSQEGILSSLAKQGSGEGIIGDASARAMSSTASKVLQQSGSEHLAAILASAGERGTTK